MVIDINISKILDILLDKKVTKTTINSQPNPKIRLATLTHPVIKIPSISFIFIFVITQSKTDIITVKTIYPG